MSVVFHCDTRAHSEEGPQPVENGLAGMDVFAVRKRNFGHPMDLPCDDFPVHVVGNLYERA